MNDTIQATPNDLAPEHVADDPAPAVEPAPEEPAPEDAGPETYSAEYVKGLREEAAAHRVRAKRIDEANGRLVAAFAAADGRLVPDYALEVSDDLLDDGGLVDPDAVTEAIDALITKHPSLRSRRPTTSLPMGVQPEAPTAVGWLDVIRGEVR